MDELSPEDKLTVFRARKIQRFLSQPFSVAQVFTGREGKQVPVAETVRGFKEILEGKHDDVAEGNFYMKGVDRGDHDRTKKWRVESESGFAQQVAKMDNAMRLEIVTPEATVYSDLPKTFGGHSAWDRRPNREFQLEHRPADDAYWCRVN